MKRCIGTTTSRAEDDSVEASGQGPIAANHTSAASCSVPIEDGSNSFADGYNAQRYTNMHLDPGLSELFAYVGRYRPEKRQLPCELKPFIPDYIAAMGDVDEFLKPPRPDGRFEPLGLKVLDEPSVHQSDPAIMRKFLRAHMKGTAADAGEVHEDDDAIQHCDHERDAKIDQWISDVEQLRGTEVAGEVCAMPLLACDLLHYNSCTVESRSGSRNV